MQTRFNSKRRQFAAAVAVLIAVLAGVQTASAQRQSWGGQAEWGLGLQISLNDRDEVDALVLEEDGTPLPFVYIPCTERGTVMRIQVETGEILGEYLVGPDSVAELLPSRTAVDRFGNLWVANYRGRDVEGRVTRIGIVSGGTRTDADGNPDENGQYLKPPFVYNSCVDRDGDGLIRTSRGGGDILPWLDPNGDDREGGVSTAEDECITVFSQAGQVPQVSTLSIDSGGGIWVGSLAKAGVQLTRLDGVTGEPQPEFEDFVECFGFAGEGGGGERGGGGGGGQVQTPGAGLVDSFGTIWISGNAKGGRYVTRYDPDDRESAVCYGEGGEGPAVDPVTGMIWVVENRNNNATFRMKHRDTGDTLLSVVVDQANCDSGMVVDHFRHVWAADTDNGTIVHLAPDPQDPEGYILVGRIPLVEGAGPEDPVGVGTGVSIDSFGNVWAAIRDTNEAVRVDPVEGGIGAGSIPVGAVDLRIDLGAGATPEAYSDMTGHVTMGTALGGNEGQWSTIWDSGTPGANWGTARWDDFLPLGTAIYVEVRASDDPALLPTLEFEEVENDVPFGGVQGQHIEILVTFVRSARGPSPVLYELEIEAVECYLAVGKGGGNADFQPGGGTGHVFQTQLDEVKTWYPVLMERNPIFKIALPGTHQPGVRPSPSKPAAPVTPVRRVNAQVFMYNPSMFPENPEQFTARLEVSVWLDGRVTSRVYGDSDGMQCDVEVVERGPGYVKVQIPFTIDGMP